MTQSLLSVFLAAALATSPVYADDGFDFFGGGGQTEKPAKAPREKNDGRGLETMAKSFGTGVGVGAVGVAALGAAALNPVFIVGGSLIIADKINKSQGAKFNAFYSGTVMRGRVRRVVHDPHGKSFGRTSMMDSLIVIPDKLYGFDLKTFPSDEALSRGFNALHVNVIENGTGDIFALVPKGSQFQNGDIVDVKFPVGVFAFNTSIFDNLHFDFNKHMPRVVNVYCKHDNPTCQNDYDSSLGVLYRHQDTEFPPSQYLIDPAVIAADQERMRKEETDKKAAKNAGGFSFL